VPLLRFDIPEGRTAAEIRALLDSAHSAVVDAFDVPERDRYQVVHTHPEAHMVVQDTGLGIERSDDVVLIQVTSRPRSTEQKQAFYRLVVANLERDCGIAPSDVMVSIIENADADWSFGHGRAQFLTGEL
jgi:phenylpyruvate tautomerase PptA (4-oxalocrotonate tautomerase family)